MLRNKLHINRKPKKQSKHQKGHTKVSKLRHSNNHPFSTKKKSKKTETEEKVPVISKTILDTINSSTPQAEIYNVNDLPDLVGLKFNFPTEAQPATLLPDREHPILSRRDCRLPPVGPIYSLVGDYISIPTQYVESRNILLLAYSYGLDAKVVVHELTPHHVWHPARRTTFHKLGIQYVMNPKTDRYTLFYPTTLRTLQQHNMRRRLKVDAELYNQNDPIGFFLAGLEPVVVELDGGREITLQLRPRVRKQELGNKLRTNTPNLLALTAKDRRMLLGQEKESNNNNNNSDDDDTDDVDQAKSQSSLTTPYVMKQTPFIFNVEKHFAEIDPEFDDVHPDQVQQVPTTMQEFAKDIGVIPLKDPLPIPTSSIRNPNNRIRNFIGTELKVIFCGAYNKGTEMKRIYDFFIKRNFEPISQLLLSHTDVKLFVGQLYKTEPHWLQWATDFNPCGYTAGFLEYLDSLQTDKDRYEAELLFWSHRLPQYVRTLAQAVRGRRPTIATGLGRTAPRGPSVSPAHYLPDLAAKVIENPYYISQNSVFNRPHDDIIVHQPRKPLYPLPKHDPSVDIETKGRYKVPSTMCTYASDFGTISIARLPVPPPDVPDFGAIQSQITGGKVFAGPFGYWNQGTEMHKINEFFKARNFKPISQKFHCIEDCYEFLSQISVQTPKWIRYLTDYNLGGYSYLFLQFLAQHENEPTAVRAFEDRYWEQKIRKQENGKIFGNRPDIKERQKRYDEQIQADRGEELEKKNRWKREYRQLLRNVIGKDGEQVVDENGEVVKERLTPYKPPTKGLTKIIIPSKGQVIGPISSTIKRTMFDMHEQVGGNKGEKGKDEEEKQNDDKKIKNKKNKSKKDDGGNDDGNDDDDKSEQQTATATAKKTTKKDTKKTTITDENEEQQQQQDDTPNKKKPTRKTSASNVDGDNEQEQQQTQQEQINATPKVIKRTKRTKIATTQELEQNESDNNESTTTATSTTTIKTTRTKKSISKKSSTVDDVVVVDNQENIDATATTTTKNKKATKSKKLDSKNTDDNTITETAPETTLVTGKKTTKTKKTKKEQS